MRVWNVLSKQMASRKWIMLQKWLQKFLWTFWYFSGHVFFLFNYCKHCNTTNPDERHTIVTDLYSAEPCVVPARMSAGWSPVGTPELLHGGWLEELSATHHCPAACWHQPRSQWHSHLPVHTIRDAWMDKTHTAGTLMRWLLAQK